LEKGKKKTLGKGKASSLTKTDNRAGKNSGKYQKKKEGGFRKEAGSGKKEKSSKKEEVLGEPRERREELRVHASLPKQNPGEKGNTGANGTIFKAKKKKTKKHVPKLTPRCGEKITEEDGGRKMFAHGRGRRIRVLLRKKTVGAEETSLK